MELIKIFQSKLIDAHELYQFLEIKTSFNNWVSKEVIVNFKEDEDFFLTLDKTSCKSGKLKRSYHLKLDTAKKLAMMSETPKGEEARNYFIGCEKTITSLKNHIFKSNGTEKDYIQIDITARKIFLNGQVIPDEELSSIDLIGREFAKGLTEVILEEGDYSLQDIDEINKGNHRLVREVISNSKKHKQNLTETKKLE